MSPKVTIEVDAKHEAIVRRPLALAEEMEQLALTAPDGEVFDACEGAVVEKGRRFQGQLLGVADESEREHRRGPTERLLGYFAKQTNRLNYAERLQAGRAIGSGQVEGEAKTLGLRLKRRDARWNKRHVQPMASLVCVRHTRQWDAYWSMAA